MPVMDGYQTTIQLRSEMDNPNHGIPVIALTASALKDEKDKALACGMNAHIPKPFKPKHLRVKIDELLSKVNPTESNVVTGAENFDYFGLDPEIFDLDELKELYDDDFEHLKQMFTIFNNNIIADYRLLGEAVMEMDRIEIARLAHKIAPTFSMIGLNNGFELCKHLELSAKEQEASPLLEKHFGKLKIEANKAFHVVKEALNKWS